MGRLTTSGAISKLALRRIGAGPGSTGYVYQGSKATARSLNPHTYDIAELYVLLTEAARADRCLLLGYEPEPYCHRLVAGRELKPDAHIRIEVGGAERNRYLEADRGTEWPYQLRDKLDQYLEAATHWPPDEVFPRVVFVVSHELPDRLEPRRRLIARQIERLPAEYHALFTVTTLDDAVDHLLAPA